MTPKPQTNISRAYVVKVASGEVRAFDLPIPERPSVADYGPAGIYIVSASGLGGPGEGVWLLDPGTGSVNLLRQIHQVWMVRDGYAWIARFDPRDTIAWPPSELAPANSLVRIDLATGAETIWFYQAGRYPWMIGLASRGRPVVVLGGSGGNEVRIIDQPGSPGQLIYSGDTGRIGLNDPQPDGDRLWFGGEHGIYLYRPDRGFQKVFAYSADPTTAPHIQPGGFCSLI